MRADQAMDELMELRRTIERLHEPNIITAEIGDYRPARIHLHVTGDPTEIVQDMGLGLIDRDEDWDPAWERQSITDINGVEVYWLKFKKKAPDAATSEAPKVETENTITEIVSCLSAEVKEDHHEDE